MDAIVAAPYGITRAQKDKDYAEIQSIEAALFPVLFDALNHYHGTQHGERFWRIVLGHWFDRFITVVFNRLRTLEYCLEKYSITGTTLLRDEGYSLACPDSIASIWACGNDQWNDALLASIVKLSPSLNLPVEFIATDDVSEGFRMPAEQTQKSYKRELLKWGIRQAEMFSRLLKTGSTAFIISTCLPRKEEIKLKLSFGLLPFFGSLPALKVSKKTDRELRRRLTELISDKKGNTLSGLLRSLLFELLPVCFLEGFAELQDEVNKLHWPEKPEFIFTSNEFDINERFKLWTAGKVESGCSYITGQHGSNYGTHRYINKSIEEVTADRFFTFGWKDGLKGHTPAFILTTAGKTKPNYNPDGGLLLIELHASQRLTVWDEVFCFTEYFADQLAFLKKLLINPYKGITIRLHPAYRYLKWFEEKRWRDFDQNVKVETGVLPIRDLIANSRLVVHSYDSAGILETLSQNIPTLAFWQNGFDHLRESAIPYYQMLADAGIIHLSAESAANKVNTVWTDVDGWWSSREVQKARKLFCDRYARTTGTPVRELKKLLLQKL